MTTKKTFNKLTAEATIEQIVTTGPNAAALLDSIGLKPEQYQNQTLRSACQKLQWNEEELLNWIRKHHDETECIKNEPKTPGFDDDIVECCHWLSHSIQPCIRKLLTDITSGLPGVQLIHGNQYTWLKNIGWHFYTLKDQLDLYLLLEKETFFPLAIELNNRKESILYGKAKDLTRALEILESDRPKIMKEMNNIKAFSNSFEHPAGACSTSRILHADLSGLATQLARYFFIEQNQLFPQVKKQLQSS